ncbi:MAG TPA: VCBS repeat-containing protein, partial [Polyangia bacterium]
KGVALWVIKKDGTRPAAFTEPFHVPAYLAGLEDLGDNIVGLTNQVAVADLDPDVPGLDVVFAGYDGKVHLVGADRKERWTFTYTTAANVLTGGFVVADLSADGVPEIVFATYSTDAGKSSLFVLDATGTERAKLALPGRGAMAVPTVADIDGDGALEILVNLKDSSTTAGLVFTVRGSQGNCLPWPTGRANYLRSGYVRRK